MSIHDRTSQERIKKCAENGAHSEEQFVDILTTFHFKVFDATKEENIKDHIDKYFTTPETIYWSSNQKFSVDIKGIKDFSKCTELPKNMFYNILEYTNVNGKDGWLFGKADYVAFETETDFMLVERQKLINFAKDNISNFRIDLDENFEKEHGRKPTICDAFHKLFRRPKTHDIITVVSNEELKPLACYIFRKDKLGYQGCGGIA